MGRKNKSARWTPELNMLNAIATERTKWRRISFSRSNGACPSE